MRILETIQNVAGSLSRRSFLHRVFQAGTALFLSPLISCKEDKKEPGPDQMETGSYESKKVQVRGEGNRVLLKKGLVVDGSGQKPFIGDLLIKGGNIEMVSPHGLDFNGMTLDCEGMVIAPGFIDAHSHMDWILPIDGILNMKLPFTAQGVTSFVTGNCGFGVAGFPRDSRYLDLAKSAMRGLSGTETDSFFTMDEYFTYLKRKGMTHNIINLAGHGTTRTSIRGYKADPLSSDEMDTMLRLLEEAMDQGAYGVSLGLQYEPGIFATDDELKKVALLAKKNDKIITVHMKAYSSLSPTYTPNPMGPDHNILALAEMLNLARETGVRLQVSHLIFVGTKTWKTCGQALDMIESARDDGVDVKFDTYAYHCGNSVINVFLPKWFLSKTPEIFDDQKALARIKREFTLIKWLLGFGYQDIQITFMNHPELNEYNGMFLPDIAKKRKMSEFDTFIDIAKKTKGKARVLNHRYSSLENVKDLMRHPLSLYMTDAIPAPTGVQNPAAFGNFPRFLQYARDFKLNTLEEVVNKMTGATADRFHIKNRGLLKKGYAADITVFDWKNIKDNNTDENTDQAPSGIEMVFINGRKVTYKGKVDGTITAGMVV